MAKISDLARYWNVSRPVAEKICSYHDGRYGLQLVHGKPKRYRWADIWAAEGYSIVAEKNWRAMKEPLLKTADLADPNVFGRSERSIRRLAEIGEIPSVDLPIADYRFRAIEIMHLLP
ncbi:hypothetical protein [Cohaesibacter intestini]|uniref:hypothetical protein n=1 Tax=Cohaesibacter intestini TaxID=2211145 RepID=UPI00130060AF|nr:hypothetical protein [Cohaesibacter intestini]